MPDKIASARAHIELTTGYLIPGELLVKEALDTTGLVVTQANRRLALVGDMVLQAAIVDDWYPTGQPTGIASNWQQTIARNTNLARVGREAGLDAHIVVSPSQQGRRVSDKTLATAVEAVLGAIYLYSGKDLNAVKTAMDSLGLTRGGAA